MAVIPAEAEYRVHIDWGANNDFGDANDDVTAYVIADRSRGVATERGLYADHEHERRERELRAAFRATITEATDAATAATAEAEDDLGRAEADPIHALSTSELERASLLRSLLREWLLAAPLRDVDAEVQAVLREGDRASRYATWSLVAERRQARVEAAVAAAPDLTARLRAEHGPEAGPLASMAERLRATLVDGTARTAARERAEATRSEAEGIMVTAGLAAYMETEYGPRPAPAVEVRAA